MLTPPFDLDDVMAPLGAARFFAEYEGKQPLHLKGTPDKFRGVMSWVGLNTILSQATIWSKDSLQLVLDQEPVPSSAYCTPAAGRDGGQVLRPDPARVKPLLARGATLVANDIDHLTPGLTAFAKAMEQALKGKVQGNLYLSSKRRQGFGAHFDTHDVYAVHVEGTKTWHVYENRAPDPIAHPRFKRYGRDYHEQAKGGLMMDVHMEPGDLLYLPRGWYHDALADEGGCIHVACGITYPIGLDVMTLLFERLLEEPEFRANLPRPDGPAAREALAGRLHDLGRVVRRVLQDPKTMAGVESFQRGYVYPRDEYDLPELLAGQNDEAYRVHATGIRLVEHGGRRGLVREGSKQATEVPLEVADLVAWVLQRKRFSRDEMVEAFPDQSSARIAQVLRDLGAMKLTEPA